ncbi:hypothetical protein G3M48_009486 [Beauveria asiatica]|uniref:Uncharacterized protein n=1 Tax=Beauveria asiatica TaxID=1069075 RepID=A0AAW0RJ56_9HYPO
MALADVPVAAFSYFRLEKQIKGEDAMSRAETLLVPRCLFMTLSDLELSVSQLPKTPRNYGMPLEPLIRSGDLVVNLKVQPGTLASSRQPRPTW